MYNIFFIKSDFFLKISWNEARPGFYSTAWNWVITVQTLELSDKIKNHAFQCLIKKKQSRFYVWLKGKARFGKVLRRIMGDSYCSVEQELPKMWQKFCPLLSIFLCCKHFSFSCVTIFPVANKFCKHVTNSCLTCSTWLSLQHSQCMHFGQISLYIPKLILESGFQKVAHAKPISFEREKTLNIDRFAHRCQKVFYTRNIFPNLLSSYCKYVPVSTCLRQKSVSDKRM